MDPRDLFTLDNPEQWTEDAACRGADPDLFSPLTEHERRRRPRGAPAYPPRAEYAARRYCSTCPVIEDCRRKAEEKKEQGVWHGAWRVGQYTTHRTIDIDTEQRSPAA